MTRPWILIGGGGTAGHILPALTVAGALVERGHDPSTIQFVGSRFGLEGRMVPAAGFSLTALPGRGLTGRRLNLANARAAVGLVLAVVQAVAIVARRRPQVVLSVGGYAALPCALAAAVLRVPVVVAESNAVPGATNRLVGRVARATAVQFPGTGLPNEVVTGSPVRPEVLAVDRSPAGRRAARAALGLPDDRVVVAAFGGSLGSRRINTAVAAFVEAHGHRSDLAVRHAVGRRDWAAVRDTLPVPPAGGLVYQPVEYEEEMATLLAAADLAVTRAGGSTLSELAVVGLPAVLVPLPIAHRDHQTANAEHFVRAGAAVRVPDAELDGARLAAELDRLLAGGRLDEMGAAARILGHPDASERIAALLEEHARG